MALRRTSGPAAEPVTLAEALDHLRVSGSDSDLVVEALIVAARTHLEDVTRRSWITQTWELTLDDWPAGDVIELPRPPALALSSLTYVDTDGTTQTLTAADYQLDVKSEPARLLPAYNDVWPTCRDVPNAVTVTYTAGYGATPASVPGPLKQALLLLVSELYENREAAGDRPRVELPFAVSALVAPYRVWSF